MIPVRGKAMNRFSIWVLVWLIVPMCFSDGLAAEGYEILFENVTSKLTLEEKRQIFRQLKFNVSEDGKFFAGHEDKDVSPVVEVVDLNGDGVEEVFVHWGNSYTSGNAERSITLFVKDAMGQYVMNLGIPAGGYGMLATRNLGFPDLEFYGPGFCRGVWRWNGSRYKYRCSREDKPGGCAWRGVKTLCP
jgi:hypothetical protein